MRWWVFVNLSTDVYTHQTILKAHLLKMWNRSHLQTNFSLTTKNGWNNVTLFCRVFFSQNNKNCCSFFLLFIFQHVVDLRRTSVGRFKFEVSFSFSSSFLVLFEIKFCFRVTFEISLLILNKYLRQERKIQRSQEIMIKRTCWHLLPPYFLWSWATKYFPSIVPQNLTFCEKTDCWENWWIFNFERIFRFY